MLKQIDLGGTWKAMWADGQRGRRFFANLDNLDPKKLMDVTVPGEIHLDLMRHGLIDDPYIGINCLKARWVEEMHWSFRRVFDAPKDALTDRAWLYFEGLDLTARIFLNGTEVGRHNNYFYPCRLEVTGKLKPTDNLLTVHLEAGYFDTAEKPNTGYYSHPDMTNDPRMDKRQWMRKPQFMFDWDWSTKLANCGIFKPVRLEYTSAPARLDEVVPMIFMANDLKSAEVVVRFFLEGLKDEATPAVIEVELDGQTYQQSVELLKGLNPYEIKFIKNEPKLWWPIGHGEPNLYAIKAIVKSNGVVIGEKAFEIGFRKVLVNQAPHPEGGTYFTIEVNNRKIFCKGANFVPSDMIMARINKERYEVLVNRAIEANFNFLRIWGGGQYESDEFYEICNRHGILVWQEFIFACWHYPAEQKEFNKNIKAEAIYNVRRLAKHPSLVIWCGNNEIEWLNYNEDARANLAHPDHGLFHLILPRIVRNEDGVRFYLPSSPYSPNGEDPNSHITGDQHPWLIGFLNVDFREYRNLVCRFPNEGGILGPPAWKTLLACLDEKDQSIHSFAWQIHENSVDSWDENNPPDRIFPLWLGKNIKEMSLDDYFYYGGLLQGEGLSQYIDNFRRRMFTCSAAIFWMFNDCWPAVRSWTIVDYYLRRTPSFYPVRRAMSPIRVVLTSDDKTVTVWGVNEEMEVVAADLRFGVMGLSGGFPYDETKKVVLEPNASIAIAEFAIDKWSNPASTMAFALLEKDGKLISRNRHYQLLFREMEWAKPEVKITVRDGKAIFECDVFVWGLCIDREGETQLADNFFDIYPGIPYEIEWQFPNPPKIYHYGNLCE